MKAVSLEQSLHKIGSGHHANTVEGGTLGADIHGSFLYSSSMEMSCVIEPSGIGYAFLADLF
jgi:hypothetical protein